ncbi:type II CAAX prenyl endopeptidase Rce1 family protein [Legionella longbeachae]|uniref:Cyclic nucleotide-binding domain-containing protein n=1 Tax=Legionella longbeachae serogroup 1 (strain NSW150) TaxID=661367 RepID=D3HTN1_LEGLN|nr:CPBP family glutamic-type intramembrane protease [Legionella longbeachae]VEE02788.1 CAAX amino terminal protease family protein [Legionella oakridgensis]HBD7397971.1 cyclic nucleotide-binding domain-containing protein [Legionella pneumophila]ARB90963.1 CPBP family intramembrane metalloprotease domain-containing protein [Legionella longbeachae]ARM32610.1 cyclic nucleotide-binding domain-containing protein [Legionella longbeachae]EEZ94625.1 cyclic nucleotide-binding domain/CAAX amino terminal
MEWNKEKIQILLQQHPLFSELQLDIIEQLAEQAQIRTLEPSQFLFKQGALDEDAFYLILSGETEVLQEKTTSVVLNVLKPGVVLGENAFWGERERLASIRAKTKSEYLVLLCHVVQHLLEKNYSSVTSFIRKLHAQTLKHLVDMNQSYEKSLEDQREAGYFIVSLVSFLSIYSVATPILQELATKIPTTYISTGLIIVGMLFLVTRMTYVGMPLSHIGITRSNLKKSLLQSFFLSLAIIALLIVLKMFLLYIAHLFGDKLSFYKSVQKNQLFYTYPERMFDKYGLVLSNADVIFFAVLYTIHAFFQELLARGSLQGMFTRFLPYKNNTVPSIVLASLIFSAAHVYHSTWAVGAVFVPGLLMGWLYSKQQNIFGVSLFHIMIGLGFFLFIG